MSTKRPQKKLSVVAGDYVAFLAREGDLAPSYGTVVECDAGKGVVKIVWERDGVRKEWDKIPISRVVQMIPLENPW